MLIKSDLEPGTVPGHCTMVNNLKGFEMRDCNNRMMTERFERINARVLETLYPRLVRILVHCERLECDYQESELEGGAVPEDIGQPDQG